jgi:hypothetical protein
MKYGYNIALHALVDTLFMNKKLCQLRLRSPSTDGRRFQDIEIFLPYFDVLWFDKGM